MKALKHARVLILGSGPAGYSAAVCAARANLQPILVTGLQQGGKLVAATDAENWSGQPLGMQRPDLRECRQHVVTTIVFDNIHTAHLREQPIRLMGDSGTYTCDALIIAAGAPSRHCGVASKAVYTGRGVSACSTCDGFFYRGLNVLVVGGGNTALEVALYLSNISSKVTLMHRRDRLRAEPILIDGLMAKVAEGRVVLA